MRPSAAVANPHLPRHSTDGVELSRDRDGLLFLSSLPAVTPPRLAAIVSSFATYRDFATASPGMRAAKLGPWVTDLPRLPATPEPVVLPRGVSVLLPDDDAYPANLRRQPTLAPILFTTGYLPATTRSRTPEVVAVTGTRFPSRTGLAVAANAGRSIARYSMVTAAVMAVGVGGSAIASAVSNLGTAIAVLPSGHSCYPAPQILSDLVAFSGCAISPFYPSTPPSDAAYQHATALAVNLASAVVCADVGSPLSSHRSCAPEAAQSAGVPIIAPHPEDSTWPSHSDLGLLSLTSRRHREPRAPFATRVVSSPDSLDDAVREVSVRLRHFPAPSRPPQRVSAPHVS